MFGPEILFLLAALAAAAMGLGSIGGTAVTVVQLVFL